nr:MAG TPA: hypothetical protein [Caudoviricetes sp.]
MFCFEACPVSGTARKKDPRKISSFEITVRVLFVLLAWRILIKRRKKQKYFRKKRK